jgi:hypothetical protein
MVFYVVIGFSLLITTIHMDIVHIGSISTPLTTLMVLTLSK